MKLLIWLSGLVFFLGIACATFLIVDHESATRFLEGWPRFERLNGKPGAIENIVVLLRTNWLFYALVAAAAGFVWMALVRYRTGVKEFRRLKARAVERAKGAHPAAPPGTHALAPASVPTTSASTESFLAQLEVNWKTFASYTQDLLHKKLKEFEDLPQKAAREVVAHLGGLASAIEDLRQDLGSAKAEWRDATAAMGERLARALETARRAEKAEKADGAGARLEALTHKMEEGINAAREHFAATDARAVRLVEVIEEERQNIVQERLVKEVERLEQEWRGRIAALTSEIDDGKRERERLATAIARAAETESNLRGELDRAASRQGEYQRRLDDAATGLEKQAQAVRSATHEIEGLRKEIDRQGKAGESERRTLLGKVEELEGQGTLLESERESAVAEIERLVGVLKSHDVELNGLRTAVQSLREEKTRLEDDARRLGEELKSMLAGRAAADRKRVQTFEEENARLRAEIEALRRTSEEKAPAPDAREVEALRGELAAAARKEERAAEEVGALRRDLETARSEVARLKETPAVEPPEVREPPAEVLKTFRLELDKVERERQEAVSRALAAEKQASRLKAEAGTAEGVWRSRVAELERELAQAREKFAENVADPARRKHEPAAARGGAHGPSANGDRLRELELEKKDLMVSMDRLGAELERLRGDIDGFRRFQGALIEGSIPAAIAAVDVGLKVFAWNPAAEELWGKSSSAVLGRVLNELSIAGLHPGIIEDVRIAMRERRTFTLPPSTFSDRKGKPRHLRWSCDPILGPDGAAIGALLIADEVTQEVEKEIEARLQAFFSQSLLRSLPAALVVLDTHHRVISWNQNAEALLGVDEGEAVGADFFSLKTPLAKTAFQKRYEENERHGGIHRVKARLPTSPGGPTYYTITQAPFVGNDGAVRGSMLLLQSAGDPLVPASQAV